MKRIINRNSSNGGFTILELIMVVFILSTIAYATLPLLENSSDQMRYDDTKNRLKVIRSAIIGDTSRTINGGAEIRGYVADMGGLPENLNALLRKDYCDDPQYFTRANCIAASEAWTTQGGFCVEAPELAKAACSTALKTWQPDYDYIDEYAMWFGWNGPYLKSSATFDPTNVAPAASYPGYPDGWGRTIDSTNNFGWRFSIYQNTNGATETEEHLLVQSSGRDSKNTATTSDYDANYPRVDFPNNIVLGSIDFYSGTTTPPSPGVRFISNNEYLVAITSNANIDISVDFIKNTPPTTPQKVCARLQYRKDRVIDELVSTNQPLISITTGTQTEVFTFTNPDLTFYLPIGTHTLGIYQFDTTTTPPCTRSVHPAAALPIPFTILPGVTFLPSFVRVIN